MGDGQHGWAAAEWIAMIRNMFVREEESRLIFGSGVFPEWLESDEPIRFGPTPTPYGDVSLSIESGDNVIGVHWDADWRNKPDAIRVTLPEYPDELIENPTEAGSVELQKVTA